MCRVTVAQQDPINPDIAIFQDAASKRASTKTPTTTTTHKSLSSLSSETQKRGLKSILRESSFSAPKPHTLRRVKNISFIPALVFAEEGDTLSQVSSTDSFAAEFEEESDTNLSCTKKYSVNDKLSFSSRVLVQEFFRAPGEKERTWYTEEQLHDFGKEAIDLVREYERTHWRSIFFSKPRYHIHSHPALMVPNDEDEGLAADETPTLLNRSSESYC